MSLKRSAYRFNAAEAAARKAAREAAKAQHGQAGGLPQVNAKVDRLEKIIGVVKAE